MEINIQSTHTHSTYFPNFAIYSDKTRNIWPFYSCVLGTRQKQMRVIIITRTTTTTTAQWCFSFYMQSSRRWKSFQNIRIANSFWFNKIRSRQQQQKTLWWEKCNRRKENGNWVNLLFFLLLWRRRWLVCVPQVSTLSQ